MVLDLISHKEIGPFPFSGTTCIILQPTQHPVLSIQGVFCNGAHEHQVSDILWFWMQILTKQMKFLPSLVCHVQPCGHLNPPSFYTRSVL